MIDEVTLKRKAYKLRKDIIEMVYKARSGHPGGALGMADVMTVLWYRFLRDRPKDPKWPDRDRFILSNGHTCPILYAILADKGYFPREELWRFRKLGAILQGHPSTLKTPGVELSGGSLGNGLSFAVGVALAGKLDRKDWRVYCSISDAECQEGQTWEAALAAHHYKLGNLIAILDRNDSQIDGPTEEVMALEPLSDKWKAFGWWVLEIDGHNYEQIISAFEEVTSQKRQKPSMIICHNMIGKGVSFMEGNWHWHHGAPTEEQLKQAFGELDGVIQE